MEDGNRCRSGPRRKENPPLAFAPCEARHDVHVVHQTNQSQYHQQPCEPRSNQLVVDLSLWKIMEWVRQLGSADSQLNGKWKNTTCSKPPISQWNRSAMTVPGLDIARSPLNHRHWNEKIIGKYGKLCENHRMIKWENIEGNLFRTCFLTRRQICVNY